MKKLSDQNNPELVARGMALFIEDQERPLEELLGEEGPTPEFIDETVEVMGCSPEVALRALQSLYRGAESETPQSEEKELTEPTVPVIHESDRSNELDDTSLAILVGLCKLGGTLQGGSVRHQLSAITGVKPSRINPVLDRILTKGGFTQTDLGAKDQYAAVTRLGVETIKHNLHRIDFLTPNQLTTFPERTFRLLDYMVNELSSPRKRLKYDENEESLLKRLSDKAQISKSYLSSLISELQEDGYMEVQRIGNKSNSKIAALALTPEGQVFRDLLAVHLESGKDIQQGEVTEESSAEDDSEADLDENLEFMREEIRNLSEETGIPSMKPHPLDKMSKEKIREEINSLRNIIPKLIEIADSPKNRRRSR